MEEPSFISEISDLHSIGAANDKLLVYPRVLEKALRDKEISTLNESIPILLVLKRDIDMEYFKNDLVTLYSPDQIEVLEVLNNHYMVIPITSPVSGVQEVIKALTLGKRVGRSPVEGRCGDIFVNTTIISIFVNGNDILGGAHIYGMLFPYSQDNITPSHEQVVVILEKIFNELALAIAV